MRLFSTEQVSKYHPDKYADQISDAILDACLENDENSRVACETLVKDDVIILAGEITSGAGVDYREIARNVAQKLGYPVNSIETFIRTQSPEIAAGVGRGKDQGAGDQGIMYGYACNQTASGLPFGFDLVNQIIEAIEKDVGTPSALLLGDAKCQVTVDLDEPATMQSVKKILVSACHKPERGQKRIRAYINAKLDALGVPASVERIINPAGAWTIGGPFADAGLTGRKIVCDQYGGFCPVGGGAFSGKDPSKVDRSGAYMARKIARSLQLTHGLKWCEVQLGYAIGRAEPVSVSVNSDLSPEINAKLTKIVLGDYDLTPAGIIANLDLLNVKYEKIAEGCHYRLGGGV